MAGEDEAAEEYDMGAVSKKPVWQRMLITCSGAVMNLALGIVIMFLVVVFSANLGSTKIISFVDDNAVSYKTGLMPGDEIIKIAGSNVHIANDLIYEIMRCATEPISVTVIRGGAELTLSNVTFPTVTEQGMLFGSVDFYVYGVKKTPLTVLKHAYYQSVSSVKMIWQSVFDLITGKLGIQHMSGPVGVTTAISEAVDEGGINVLYLCAIMSLNLGILNLLPFPALDGGRMVFHIIELIRRKPVRPEYEGYVHLAGIILLMLLMVAVTFQDITKLFAK